MGKLFSIIVVGIVAFVLSVGFTGMYLSGKANVAVAAEVCVKCKHEKCPEVCEKCKRGYCERCPICAEIKAKKKAEK